MYSYLSIDTIFKIRFESPKSQNLKCFENYNNKEAIKYLFI